MISSSSAQAAVVAAAVAMTLPALSGCRNDPSDGKYPALVKVPKAQPDAGASAGADVAEPVEPAWKVALDKVRRSTEKGPAGFSSKRVIDLFKQECLAEHAAAGPIKSDGDGDLTSAYGRVWEGDRTMPDLGGPPKDDVFVWTEGDAEYLDPNLIAESAGNAIAQQMFETLLIPAPGNTEPKPGVAERYEVSSDGKTYTFHLRKNATWSDGKPVNAHDFKYAWLRGLSPALASKNAQQLWYIKGAKAFNAGKVEDPNTVGITVKDDYTLVVELEAPAAFFPHLVTYVAYAPVPKHVIDKHGKRWTDPDKIVVNGPFIMTKWTPRATIEMVRNPKYWDVANVKLTGTTVLLGDSQEKNLNYYKSGQAHVARPIPADQARQMIKQGRKDLKIDQLMCTYYYIVRMDKPPFDDPLVRRAINMAIDRETLTKQTLGLFQVPATALLPDMYQGTVGYRTIKGDNYDPTRAKKLLAEAGYPGGRGIPPIELVYNTYETHKLIAEFVQRNLKELGIEVSINNMEWKSLLKKQRAGDFQIARTSWCADYPDPLTFLEVFVQGSANNYSKYWNPAFDALIEEIKRETDRTKRNAAICAAEKALNRDVPLMPFYFYTRSYLLRPFVKGYEAQYQDHHLLKWISIDRTGSN